MKIYKKKEKNTRFKDSSEKIIQRGANIYAVFFKLNAIIVIIVFFIYYKICVINYTNYYIYTSIMYI